MSYVLKFVDGPHSGRYLRFYDPDYRDGLGAVTVTNEVELAQRFDGIIEAMNEWKRPSTVHPIRETDGKPNRPMTAWSVTPEDLGDE